MVDVVIFAGGTGSRMGSKTPKQFLKIDGKPIIIHTLEKYDGCNEIDQIVVVCKEEYIGFCKQLITEFGLEKVNDVIAGGATGQESIYRGLKFFHERSETPEQDIVMMHDGVRPVIDGEQIKRCIDGVRKHGNSVAASKAIETIIRVDDHDVMKETVDRTSCRYAKAPQSFWLSDIWEAHQKALADGKTNFIDSAYLMSAYGAELHIVECGADNIKITTPNDFYMFKAMYEAKKSGLGLDAEG